MAENPWIVTHKGDPECRALADKHYTRQKPGNPRFTRPGYNYVLKLPGGTGVFVWWRPKWEDGRPGTKRKDGLEVIECTLFRNEGSGYLSSDLIRFAVDALTWPEAAVALHGITAPADGLLSGVGSAQTKGRRSRRNPPGHCYLMAGWTPFAKKGGKADVWFWHHAAAVEEADRG